LSAGLVDLLNQIPEAGGQAEGEFAGPGSQFGNGGGTGGGKLVPQKVEVGESLGQRQEGLLGRGQTADVVVG
jgi:hypothetical protein